MIICYFGSYDRNYARNSIMINGLKKNNVEIIECNDRRKYICRFFSLIKKALSMKFDVLLVAYPGHLDMFAAKIVCMLKRKPIVFDAFISTYDTMINEWGYGTRHSSKGIYYHWLDSISCRLADLVLLDTEHHIDYFMKEFKLRRYLFAYIPVGAEDSIVYPRKKTRTTRKFQILFYGYAQPLHGFEYMVDAARHLQKEKDVEFIFIGENRWYRNVRDENRDLKNVKYMAPIPYKDLVAIIANADVCLGAFGTTIKVQNAVPTKAYEALAMRKPLITGDTDAAKSVLKNRENAILCKTGSAKEIVDSIMLLKNDVELREKISENGYNLFKSNFTTKKIGHMLKKAIEEHFKKELHKNIDPEKYSIYT